MKKFFAVAGMLLLSTPLLAQDQTAAPASDSAAPASAPDQAAAAAPAPKKAKGAKGDEAGIQKAFEEISEAWASGDAHAIASHFTPDSSLINPMGMEGKGREGVEKVAGADLAGPLKGTQQAFDDFNIRFYPMPNIALVDCTSTLTGMKKPDGTDADPMKLHLFAILVNRSGKKWEALLVRPYAFLQPPAGSAASDASMAPASSNASTSPAASTDASTAPAASDASATPAAASSTPSDSSAPADNSKTTTGN